MSNVTRPVFNPRTGHRIKYATNCPDYDPNTGVRIIYGEDRSGPSWDQETGLPAGQTAQINITGAPIAQPQEVVNDVDDDGEDFGDASIVVTRISDQAYEEFPAQTTSGGLTVNQIRSMFRTALGLTDNMVALVDGQLASNGQVVDGGSNVIFKEPAKRRG